MNNRSYHPFPVLSVLITLTVTLQAQCCAQTATDIQKILKNSKGIESGRPLKAVVNDGTVTVSTYAHPKSSDQDCKINALFILKDLKRHHKTIHRLSITFYDVTNPNRYRTVDVSEEQVAAVDNGRKVQEVLSQVDIVRGDATLASSAVDTSGGGNGLNSKSALIGTLASVLGGGRGGSGAVNSTDDLMKTLMIGMGQQMYGNITPVAGPYEDDRALIAATVMTRKRAGSDTRAADQMCVDLNNLALKNDKASLAVKIPQAFTYLHITDAQAKEWRRKGGWRTGFGPGGAGEAAARRPEGGRNRHGW